MGKGFCSSFLQLFKDFNPALRSFDGFQAKAYRFASDTVMTVV